ncbi:MAG: adenylosuccinate lyase [Eubacteriales bacterium]|nr:adenylosuccinate lyase [Clostridiales bacterium]MDY5835517.1 adenylosuccinate lyase [Eubacteriales bacterium]
MLNRYSHPEMRAIWSDENIFRAWLEVEILSCEAWSELGVIPKEDVQAIRDKATFTVPRIREIEQETRHDVVAFTRTVSESLGEEKKWVHYGLTSTDVVDTAYGYLYKQANALLLTELDKLIEVVKKKALLYKDTPKMGRTHGIHAEITSFGLTMALWYAELERQRGRFLRAAQAVECGKISGAVGTFANTPPFVQDYVCEKLGIDSAAISTQILQRDRHAAYFGSLALIAASLEKFATEIRHLQRTEVREAEEYFSKGQKGSSAMPHKRNPIGSENICGCARLMRGYMLTSYEDVCLWHERDISHSSAERVLSSDATELLHYMLRRFTSILDKLVVYPENMLKNIGLTHGVIFSQHILLSLINKGMSREEAYDLVQPLAMQAWENQIEFRPLVEANAKITGSLTKEEIDQAFDPHYHLKNVDTIFQRVGLL